MLLPKQNHPIAFVNFFSLAIVALTLLPCCGLIFHMWNPPPDPYGLPLPSILEIFETQHLWTLLLRTMVLGIFVGLGSVFLGSCFAYVEQFYTYRAQKLFSLLCLLSLAMPSYILAATIGYFFDINNSEYSLLFAILILTLSTTPYAHLTTKSALSVISSSEIESLEILGGNGFQKFKILIWPQIRGAMMFSFLISFLYSISDFGAVATLNVPVLTFKLYQAVQYSDIYSATIMGFSLIFCTLPILLVLRRMRNTQRSFVSNIRPLQPKKASWMIQCSIYIVQFSFGFLACILPFYQISIWIWQGLERNRNLPNIWDATIGSLSIAILGAAITVILAFFPAWSTSQYPKWKWLQQVIYLSSAFPGILVAFALLLCSLLFGGYQIWSSLGILLFMGLSIRFVAEAFGPLQASFSQLDKRQYDSAVMLGSSLQKWFSYILYPHIQKALQISFVISFLAIVKELPITLLLGSGISPTLAFRIWDRYNEALFFEVGIYSIILLLISGYFTWKFVLQPSKNQ